VKNNIFFLILAVLLIAGITACASGASSVSNAKDKVDWAGQYTGIIPAADGPGINVQLTLRADNTFTIVYNYVDRHGLTSASGTFSWNDNGNVINLKVADFPPYYRVGRDQLTQLDLKGNRITGKLADHYVLRKIR
jgi:uncharacterized lipoprotein NlpE involved in copper resistance